MLEECAPERGGPNSGPRGQGALPPDGPGGLPMGPAPSARRKVAARYPRALPRLRALTISPMNPP